MQVGYDTAIILTFVTVCIARQILLISTKKWKKVLLCYFFYGSVNEMGSMQHVQNQELYTFAVFICSMQAL